MSADNIPAAPWLEDEAVRRARENVLDSEQIYVSDYAAYWAVDYTTRRNDAEAAKADESFREFTASLDTLVETAWRAGVEACIAFLRTRAALADDMSHMDGSRADNSRWAFRAATLQDAAAMVDKALLPPSPERSETA